MKKTSILGKVKKKLPEDWIFKLLSSTMTTAFTFYLFQFADRIPFIKELWSKNDQYFIKTFLILQLAVGVFFYFILKPLIGKLLSVFTIERVGSIFKSFEISDLRQISKIKSFIIQLFDLTLIEPNDLDSLEVLSSERDRISLELVENLSKWISLFIQFSLVSLLVYNLSAWYILPLLILSIVLISLFVFAVSIILHTLPLFDKIKSEMLLKQVKSNSGKQGDQFLP